MFKVLGGALKLASRLCKKFITEAPEFCAPQEPNKAEKLVCKILAVDVFVLVLPVWVSVAAVLELELSVVVCESC